MSIVTKTIFETDNCCEIKYSICGVCYLSKQWLYTRRSIRLFGILIGRKSYCYKQYIPNQIKFTQLLSGKRSNVKSETVDIIIPVYNGYEYLDPLFESLQENSDLPFRLFIIDDCSPDNRVYPLVQKWGKKFGEKAFVFQNKKNLGFVETVNFGLAKTQNHVILLNTDVVVPKNWMSRLMVPIFNNKKVATVTPFSNGGTIYSFPRQYINNPLISDYQSIDNCLSNLTLDNKQIKQLVFPTGGGFCMAMNKNVIRRIGFLDTIFGRGYGEENDWCLRALSCGYFSTVAYNLFVWHNQGGSFSKKDTLELIKENNKLLLERYPEYDALRFKSGNNPFFQSILFLARLIVFNKCAKSSVIIIDSSTDTPRESNENTASFVLSYNKQCSAWSLTECFNDEIYTLFDKDINNLRYILEQMEFDDICVKDLSGFPKTQKLNQIIHNIKVKK